LSINDELCPRSILWSISLGIIFALITLTSVLKLFGTIGKSYISVDPMFNREFVKAYLNKMLIISRYIITIIIIFSILKEFYK